MYYKTIRVNFDNTGHMRNAETGEEVFPGRIIIAPRPGTAFVQVSEQNGHLWPEKVVVVKDNMEI